VFNFIKIPKASDRKQKKKNQEPRGGLHFIFHTGTTKVEVEGRRDTRKLLSINEAVFFIYKNLITYHGYLYPV